MSNLYKNNFVFVSNRYEEWKNRCLVSSGRINTIITAEVVRNKMQIPEYEIHFNLSNKGDLQILKSFHFEIYGKDFCILKDRIQYINATYNPITPVVCQLFYKTNSKDIIDYVRFAMTNPDRLIEFYGYMDKLG